MPGQGSVRVRKPPPSGIGLPVASTSSAAIPGNGVVADPGLVVVTPGSGVIMIPPVSVCHQVSTIGQRPPPMWVVIPDPRFRVDRLAHRAQQPEAGEIVAGRMLRAGFHERPDRGGSGVEHRHPVTRDQRPADRSAATTCRPGRPPRPRRRAARCRRLRCTLGRARRCRAVPRSRSERMRRERPCQAPERPARCRRPHRPGET